MVKTRNDAEILAQSGWHAKPANAGCFLKRVAMASQQTGQVGARQQCCRLLNGTGGCNTVAAQRTMEMRGGATNRTIGFFLALCLISMFFFDFYICFGFCFKKNSIFVR